MTIKVPVLVNLACGGKISSNGNLSPKNILKCGLKTT